MVQIKEEVGRSERDVGAEEQEMGKRVLLRRFFK
jgi:hypothetical protein